MRLFPLRKKERSTPKKAEASKPADEAKDQASPYGLKESGSDPE